ncbi:MAG: M81 family metallopeptidase [Halobacteriales archaeon]
MVDTVLFGGVLHETNTFVAEPTGRSEFRATLERAGAAAIEGLRGTDTAFGGAIEAAEERGIDLVPTVAAKATPGGPVTRDAYEHYRDLIVEGAARNTPDLDGVFLALHGAMVPEGMDDGEGPLVSAVRETVGPDVPIAVTLDLHGNVTDRLIDAADLVVAYETHPHLDKGATGRRGIALLAETMRGDLDPVMHVERPPVLTEGARHRTDDDPMAIVMERAREIEERPAVTKVNVLPGFIRANVPSVGVSVPVVANGDPAAAREASREVAELVWDHREGLTDDYPGPAAAVAKANRLAAVSPAPGPVVLADFGPNPGAGGSASGTPVLRAFLEQGLENAGYTLLWDPEAVEACVEAGVGARVTVTLGGWRDDLHGAPIEDVTGRVRAITDGEFTNTGTSHDGAGTTTNLGRAVRFACGDDGGVTVILTERRAMSFDREIWRHVGLPPERLDVIAVPSVAAVRGDYGPMASRIIEVDSPGLGSPLVPGDELTRVRRPKYPVDDMAPDAYPDW